MKLFRVTRFHFLALTTKKMIIVTIAVFVVHYFFTMQMYNINSPNRLTLIMILFYGPASLQTGIMSWLLHQVPLLMWIGNFIHGEFKARSAYIIPRAGHVSLWLSSILIAIFMFTCLYYSLGYLVSIGLTFWQTGAQNHPFDPGLIPLLQEDSMCSLVTSQFLLIVLGSLLMMFINMLLTMAFKHSTIAFVVSITNILVAASLPHSLPFVKWMPAAQNMLIKHNISSFSLAWSLGYILIAISVLIPLIYVFINRYLEELIISEHL